MSNELLIILSVPAYLGLMAVLLRYFGKVGLYFWIVVATIFANIEVLVNVNAFGINMSLGNVLFGSSFLATDVLGERYGKESSSTAMHLGVIATIIYMLFSQFWLMFTPSSEDFAFGAFQVLFTAGFRVAMASVLVYYIAQKVDIFMYHFIWEKTTEKSKDKQKYLWLRNNGSTLLSQLINNFLFAYLAFGKINLGIIKLDWAFEPETVFSIFITGYFIMAVVALVDTPFCYLCRKMKVLKEA
ncbi:MAG: queuosine precursor transporter [Lachnospirales bacterium]